VTQLKHCRHLPGTAEEDKKQSGLPDQYVHARVHMWYIYIYIYVSVLRFKMAVMSVALI